MVTILILVAVALFGAVIFLLAKTNEYIGIIKGEENAQLENNRIGAWMMLAFGIGFTGFVIWSGYYFKDRLLPPAASEHGEWIDQMFNVTLLLTGIVFFATQLALFYFAWKYQHKKDSKAYYYPENNKLEMWWTIIPAIVMTVLVTIGLYRWFQIFSPVPSNANVVEIIGKQFNWLVRYPGPDGDLGKKDYKLIDDQNPVGIDFNDPKSLDDFMPGEIHFLINQPVLLKIGSRDVIHDVGLTHFRIKMDAVPGTPTQFWFVPTITTDSMRKIVHDSAFNYEMACDQLCGKGHWSMKMLVFVDTRAEYDSWIKKQQSFFDTQIKGTDEEKKFKSVSEKNRSAPAEPKSINPVAKL